MRSPCGAAREAAHADVGLISMRACRRHERCGYNKRDFSTSRSAARDQVTSVTRPAEGMIKSHVVPHESAIGPKPTHFVACGWSGIEGSPDLTSAILRPPLMTRSGPSQKGKRNSLPRQFDNTPCDSNLPALHRAAIRLAISSSFMSMFLSSQSSKTLAMMKAVFLQSALANERMS
jgi:hypothetical protein